MKQKSSSLSGLVYFEPSAVARRLLWHVFSLGRVYHTEPAYHEPFEKPGAHLFWVLSGRGVLELESHRYTLSVGNRVWLVDMMKTRAYVPQPGKTLTICGIRFGGAALESWYHELGGTGQAEFSLEDPSAIHRAPQEILQLATRKPRGWECEIHLKLTKILGLLLSSRKFFSPEHTELSPPVVRVLNVIEANPFLDWKVKDLAHIAGASYSSLRALFHKSQHQSLHSYIQGARLNQARQMLSDARLSIREIAERLHFSSEFYFSHFFRKQEGVSPTEFRLQLKSAKRTPSRFRSRRPK